MQNKLTIFAIRMVDAQAGLTPTKDRKQEGK